MIRWKDLFREIFQIHFPLSFFLMVMSGWKYFLRSRFRDRQIAATFCLIKERQLAVYGIQRFRVFSETIAVRYAHLFDQLFNVLIQCVQRSCNTGKGADLISDIKNLCFAQKSCGLLRCYFPDFGVQRIQPHHKITELFLCKVCGLFAGPRPGQGSCLQSLVELKETVSHP